MVKSLKELSKKEEKLSCGHRMCPGCGAPIIVRQALMATDYDVVIASATGCLEVSTTIYPFTSWKTPFIHNAFENAAATISGVETAYRVLKKKGKIKKDIKFISFGGDGGTYDIGLQSLSGALERGHKFLYIAYDNEAYMNTGIQRSSATPFGAHTTTTPAGSVHKGKEEFRKELTEIIVAHNIPYVAQASPAYYMDFMKKVEKALSVDGPSFINILSPCPRGWGFDESKSIELAKLAVDTNFWPLFEVIDGKYILNSNPKNRVPIIEWLKPQTRFRHIINDKKIIDKIQEKIDDRFKRLQMKVEMSKQLN
jgi:pyruvate ferredoxin oxidoreductase beta subunit